MSDANIKAAADNLIRAASNKRNEHKKVLNEVDKLNHNLENLKNDKKDEIREAEILAVANPTVLNVTYKAVGIHDHKEDISKAESHTKEVITKLQKEAQQLADDAAFLDQESQTLQRKA